MKALLIAINSSYSHSNTAIWYLKYSSGCDCEVCEYNINQPQWQIFSSIVKKRPDCVAFSCYIWNIETVLRLCEDISKACPEIKIVLGGPEVSFDFNAPPFIDAVLKGECEQSFPGFLKSGKVSDEYGMVSDLSALPCPYTDDFFDANKGKIIYYESSRGCPFSCSYCLSSATSGVRYLPVERVLNELNIFIERKIPLVKLCDRTFNASLTRAKKIVRYILNHNKETCFHFEIGADLLDFELISLFKSAPEGFFQLEAGIQSCCPETLSAINRKCSSEQLFFNLSELISIQNIHIHVDLIAGMPFETLKSFSDGFDKVVRLKPHALQLGFLKLLKGSALHSSDDSSLNFRSYPPYEIISTEWLSSDEIVILKGIAELTDRYFNGKYFKFCMDCLFEIYSDSPFGFFADLYAFYLEKGVLYQPLSIDRQFETLMLFSQSDLIPKKIDISSQVKLDYLCSGLKSKRPKDAEAVYPDKDFCYDYASEHGITKKYNNLTFEIINEKTYLLDQTEKTDIHGRFEIKTIG